MFKALRILVIAAFVLPWLGPIVPAEAAKIRLMNCTSTTVKMCGDEDDAELLKPKAIKHFKCNSKCRFHITECVGSKCGSCRHVDWDDKEGQNTYRLEKDRSTGNYALVALKTKDGNDKGEKIYKSSDLEKLNDEFTDSKMVCPVEPELR
jgi:hypothetical protein